MFFLKDKKLISFRAKLIAALLFDCYDQDLVMDLCKRVYEKKSSAKALASEVAELVDRLNSDGYSLDFLLKDILKNLKANPELAKNIDLDRLKGVVPMPSLTQSQVLSFLKRELQRL